MKRRIMRATIALILVFAMSAGMVASADTTESILGNRVKILNYKYLGFEVSTKATYHIYINSSAPGKRSGTHYSEEARLRQASGGKLTRIELNKDGDIADHWFYITGNGDVTTSINSTSTVNEADNFYVYARDTTATGKEDVYIEAIDRTLVRVDLVLVRQRRFSSNAAQQRTVNITVNGETKPELQPKTNPIWFADRGQTIATNQLDIEKVDTSEYDYAGNYSYDPGTLTYTVPFYTRYTVEYNGNGATSGSMSNQAFVWGTAQNLTSENFTCKHTFTYNGNGGTPARGSDTSEATFAGWTGEDGTTYQNNQSVNSLTGVSRDTFTMTANWSFSSVTLPDATREGYTLRNWLGSDGKTYNKNSNVTIDKDLTFTAQWDANTYYVSFDGNGATDGNMNDQTFKYDVSQALSENKFEKKLKVTYNPNGGSAAKTEDYAIATFNGWDSQNAVALAGVPFMYSTFAATEGSTPATLAANSALYSDRQVVINLTEVDGATVPLIANWTLGSVTLPSASRNGYVFNGWYDGNTKKGDAGSSLTPTAHTILTAQWTAVEYNITYNLNGGNDPGNPTKYTVEDAITLKAPTKENYEFLGWTGSNGSTPQKTVTISETTGDKSYTANWKLKEYAIKWLNFDGTELYSSTITHGDTPTYGGDTPTKPSDDEFEYTFSGWSPEVSPAAENMTYTAQFSEKKRKYPITFQNADGSTLQNEELDYGAMPEYNGATPTKEPTPSTVYTFAGWSSEISPVTGETIYTATYTEEIRKYSVRWMNGDELLSAEEYEYNAIPEYKGEPPTKAADTTFVYTFIGWTTELAPVTSDTVYTANFEKTPIGEAASDLIITARGCKKENDSFVFTVSSAESSAFKPLEVSIIGNNSATVKDIAIGEYTVTEDDEWSWRYGSQAPQTVTVSITDDDEKNEVIFDFTEVSFIKKWLSGLASLFVR